MAISSRKNVESSISRSDVIRAYSMKGVKGEGFRACLCLNGLLGLGWDKTLPFHQLLLYPFQITRICMVNVGFPVCFGGFLRGNNEIGVFWVVLRSG